MSDDFLEMLDKEDGVVASNENKKKPLQMKRKGASVFDNVVDPRNERTVTMTVRIPEDIFEKIRSESIQREISKSALVSKFFVKTFRERENELR